MLTGDAADRAGRTPARRQTKMLPAIVSYYEHLNYFKAYRLPIKLFLKSLHKNYLSDVNNEDNTRLYPRTPDYLQDEK